MLQRVTIIAEAGINHNGDLKTAQNLAYDAKHAGADIVKFQTYITEKLVRANDKSFNQLKALELSQTDWKALATYCRDIGIEFMTTPGELESLKFIVEELDVKRIKIGSDDLTNRSLISAAHKTGRRLILSTGMATVGEISKALDDIDNFSLMHCVSLYPCPSQFANLRTIPYLQNTFACPVGYSDHTAKQAVVVAAVAAGAELIEVHFMLDGTKPIDAPVSFTVNQLHKLVYDIRETELILGTYGKTPKTQEYMQAPLLRKGADGFRGEIQ